MSQVNKLLHNSLSSLAYSLPGQQYFNLSLSNILAYFSKLKVFLHDSLSLAGFFIFIFIFSQVLSGIMLSFSYIPEPMLVPIIREEEDLENLYIDDFFWLHERGVDYIFIFSYLHLFRKFFLHNFSTFSEASWKSGFFIFLVLQVVVFFGLVLCCTHLSEITLTIAANIFHTLFAFKGKPYWILFTDKQLNTDTLIRLTYAHYLLALYTVILAILHGIDMHYDWKNKNSNEHLKQELSWFDEALANELGFFLVYVYCVSYISSCLFHTTESVSYELFMWGDIGLIIDIRFFGVAPHWYFRPFMAWLIACPFHKTGIFGLLFLFFMFYYQPNIFNTGDSLKYAKTLVLSFFAKTGRLEFFKSGLWSKVANFFFFTCFFFFFINCLYTTSFLPYGKFFLLIGGNWGFLFSFFFIFMYLSISFFRNWTLIEMFFNYLKKFFKFFSN